MKRLCCSYRRLICSQHPHSDSQPSVTPVPGIQWLPSSTGTGHTYDAHTCMQARHSYKSNNSKKLHQKSISSSKTSIPTCAHAHTQRLSPKKLSSGPSTQPIWNDLIAEKHFCILILSASLHHQGYCSDFVSSCGSMEGSALSASPLGIIQAIPRLRRLRQGPTFKIQTNKMKQRTVHL